MKLWHQWDCSSDRAEGAESRVITSYVLIRAQDTSGHLSFCPRGTNLRTPDLLGPGLEEERDLKESWVRN
jgi:hypothetical protein